MVGNIPNYTKYDILRCLLKIEDNISRADLVNRLDLGEGTVRTILDLLKDKKLIESTRQGHSITDQGKSFVADLKTCMTLPQKVQTPFYKELKSIGLLLKNKEKKETGTSERDIAIKNGAEGALVLTFNNKFEVPGCEESFKDLEEAFNPQQNNIAVVCYAKSEKTAETAALAVAEFVSDRFAELISSII